MTRDDLIKTVIAELTISDTMPLHINTDEINRIIDKDAMKWFMINYGKAIETKYFVIRSSEFSSQSFRKTRSFVLPDCVVEVVKVTENKNITRLSGPLREYGLDRLIASELFLSSANSLGDNLLSMTARLQFLDITKAFFINDVSFEYNTNTHKLIIIGRDPSTDVILKTASALEEAFLFEDYYFIRYVTAKAKLSTARVLSHVEYNLPGGGKYNKDLFQSEGQTELESIIREIRELQPVDQFLMFN